MIRSAMVWARSVVASAADPMTQPPTGARRSRRCLDWCAIGYRNLNATPSSRFHRGANHDSMSRQWRLAPRNPSMQGPRRRHGRPFKEVVMKLYFAPGACSLSPHIVMRETGAKFELEQVNNQEKKTKSGHRLLDDQRQGPGAGVGIRQRRAADRRPRHRAVDRRPEPGLRPGPARRASSSAIASRSGSTSSPRSCTRRSARSSGRPRPTPSRRSPRRIWASASTGSTSSSPARTT